MFGHLIYFNNDKVSEYNAIILNNDIIEYNSIEVTKEKAGEADVKLLKGGKKSVESYHGTIIKNDMITCNNFMNNLCDSDNYIDFVDGNFEYDSSYLSRGNIIRIESNILIPEKFDIFKLWDSYKEYFNSELMATINKEDYNKFGKIFETKELKIPVSINIEDNIGCSQLISSLLKCDYETLETLEYDDVVILAKVISPKKRKEREIFNPLTDFLSLNRMIRRIGNVEENLPNELSKIYVENDYVSLEILAIYQ